MNKLFFLLPVALLAAACEPIEARGPDQCLRAELFQQCLAAVPKGPVVTHESDWSKIVSECQSNAYSTSWRLTKNVKPECRG